MPTKPRAREWDASPEAQAYRMQYRDTHYDRVEINLPAGMRKVIDEEARAAGLSRTAWILDAINQHMQKEKG